MRFPRVQDFILLFSRDRVVFLQGDFVATVWFLRFGFRVFRNLDYGVLFLVFMDPGFVVFLGLVAPCGHLYWIPQIQHFKDGNSFPGPKLYSTNAPIAPFFGPFWPF